MSQLRTSVPNMILGWGRSIGRTFGLELAVEVSEHGIEISMEQPDESKRAWDPDLFSSGNVFVAGYANPIKPRVNQHTTLENPDTVEVEEGKVSSEDGDTDDSADSDDRHVQLISSGRYRDYMRQDLISQLLTPESRWTLMVYAMIAIGALQFLSMIITLYATGAF